MTWDPRFRPGDYPGGVSTASSAETPAEAAASQNGTSPTAQTPIVELVGEWVTFPEVAEQWDMPVTRVHNLVSDHRLVAARREDGVRVIPSLLLTETGPLESLRGTILVLRDAGFSDDEAIRWLFTADETLPGRPIDALRDGRKTEIRRRAQALAW